MPQLFPTQWMFLINLSFLMIFLTMTMFNFKTKYPTIKKFKKLDYKVWKW